MWYTPDRFKAYELVDKKTYEELGDEAYSKIDIRILKFIDRLSIELEKFYKRRIRLICNNWYWHKDPSATDYFQWRGSRNQRYSGYRRGSYHSRVPSMAIDMHSPDISTTALIDFVLDNQYEDWCKDIGGLEIGVNWLHVDLRNRINGKILTFKA